MAHDRERRRDPRVPLVLRVEHPGARGALRDVTENLSAGGMLIRTERTLANVTDVITTVRTLPQIRS